MPTISRGAPQDLGWEDMAISRAILAGVDDSMPLPKLRFNVAGPLYIARLLPA